MKDFFMRTICTESGDMTVTKTRNSEGSASIQIKVGTQCIDIHKTMLGDDTSYEQKAFKLAQMIDEIASNPCNLTSTPVSG